MKSKGEGWLLPPLPLLSTWAQALNYGDAWEMTKRGMLWLKELKAFNVNTSQVHMVPDGKTGVCFVMVQADSGKRAFVVHSQKNLYVDLNQLNLERIRKAKMLLIDASWIEAAQIAAHFAKSHGISVVADVHEPNQPSLELLSLADYAIVPKPLAEFFGGKGDYASALHAMKSKGVKVPIIT